jgi:hypothetical protein
MIFLLVLRAANTPAVTNAVEQAKTIANGFCLLARGVDGGGNSASAAMLIHSPAAGASAIRNFLSNPLVQVAVLRVQRDWAAQGVEDIAGWLQNVDALF